MQTLTDTQHRLINELCAYVDAYVREENFDMKDFRDTQTTPDVLIKELSKNGDRDAHVCGTSGCMIGYAPMAHPELHEYSVTWGDVSQVYCDESHAIWDFMFGSIWGGYQNTPKGSVERIRLALEFDSKLDDVQWQQVWERVFFELTLRDITTDVLRKILEDMGVE
jgi:hypothetical protein